jgi:hypothetical protein
MRLKLTNIPANVIKHYNLHMIATPYSYVYYEIQTGMYGLGANKHFVKPLKKTPLLDKARNKIIQEVTKVFLFLAQVVNGTMLTPLSALASKQAIPTEATMEKCLQFLDYGVSHEDPILTYKASNMVLAIHSVASYSSEPKACS